MENIMFLFFFKDIIIRYLLFYIYFKDSKYNFYNYYFFFKLNNLNFEKKKKKINKFNKCIFIKIYYIIFKFKIKIYIYKLKI